MKNLIALVALSLFSTASLAAHCDLTGDSHPDSDMYGSVFNDIEEGNIKSIPNTAASDLDLGQGDEYGSIFVDIRKDRIDSTQQMATRDNEVMGEGDQYASVIYDLDKPTTKVC